MFAARSRRSTLPITVCVVNYNGARYLHASLRAAASQQQPPAEILLIDNDSDDGSAELARRHYPEVRVVRLTPNRGPAAARNAGLRAAAHDRILFQDNDVIPAPDCAERLYDALDTHPEAAIAMPRVLYAHDPNTIQYDGADSHFIGLESLRHADTPLSAVPCSTQAVGSLVSACFLLDRRNASREVGFDESFFIYLEDHDFGLRIRSLGLDILSVPSARCYHGEGTHGLSLRQSGAYSRTRVRCLIRNRWQLLLKNYQLTTLFHLAPVLLLFEIVQLLGVIKKGWVVPWVQAVWWIVTHPAEIARRRRLVQGARVLPDRKLLRGGPLPFTAALPRDRWERAGLRFLDRLVQPYWRMVERLL